MVNPILWQPPIQPENQPIITRFIYWLRNLHGIEVDDYVALYRWSIDNSPVFWRLFWEFTGIKAGRQGERILVDGDNMPGSLWFPDARLNYAENLLKWRNDSDFAIHTVGEAGEHHRLTYRELYQHVSRLAQALGHAGIKPGDRIVGVLPNIPETVIAMLATASLGAIWSSCSPDFGVPGLVDRFQQIQPKCLFVADGYCFKGKPFERLSQIEPLLKALPSVQTAIVIPYLNKEASISAGKITLWQDYLADFPVDEPIAFEQMAFNDPLFILYSSGTTGLPKCIVHGIGGTLIQHLKEHQLHVDIQPGERVFYYTTCGWMMWNWLVSALASGAELVLYDGSPLYPKPDRLFDLIDEYRINHFGVSAKYIDAIKKAGIHPKITHQLTPLKTILSTGSPLMPEGFDYVYQSIKSDVRLSSISGGSDIISCFVLGCPILPVRRGEIQCRGLGMDVDVFDQEGHSLRGQKGELVCKSPFPSMPVCFWNDPHGELYHAAYFEKYPGVWWHGDYVELTESGGMIIYGRSDAVLNPGGIRIGTSEIYCQVEQIYEVMESLVVGQSKDGDCRIILFVILREGLTLTEALQMKIKQQIRQNASPHHVPTLIRQVTDIPRTRNGKIAELAVRNIFHGLLVKNREALANPEALTQYENITS